MNVSLLPLQSTLLCVFFCLGSALTLPAALAWSTQVDEITGTSVQSLRDHLWLQMEAGGR